MTRRRRLLRCLAALALCACTTGVPDPPDEPDATVDLDGDTISDLDEAGLVARDSDGDGLPDFADEDSDNDGIPDADEAGDADLTTAPRDSDADGVPDYVDEDSDDNGIPDRIEGTADFDADGVSDHIDRDDDDDFVDDIDELHGDPALPRDSDGDGQPDFRDVDSDGDTILDGHEAGVDTDGDGQLDISDLDSDGDSVTDLEEAGDADPRTRPVDTDGDGTPDFRDPDSDDDGLTDELEAERGLDGRSMDTDGDGAPDAIELAGGTDARSAADNPQVRGDFVFVVPYQAPAQPGRDRLTFRTSIRSADLYFSFDASSTMTEEVDALRHPVSGLRSIVEGLLCERADVACARDSDCLESEVCARGECAEDPALGGCLIDLYTGVGQYGSTSGALDTFRNRVGLQPDPATTVAAIPTTGDAVVTSAQAAACAADPSHCLNADIACETEGVGCPGFRPDAVRIYVNVSDARDECTIRGGDPERCAMFTPEVAGEALAAQSIRFVGLVGEGVSVGTGTPEDIADRIARSSGSLDLDGAPFVYAAQDAEIVDRTIDAVFSIVTQTRFDITAASDGAGAMFVAGLEPAAEGEGCTAGLTLGDENGDGAPDRFDAVLPGARVCWDIVVRDNDTVPPQREPQIFEATVSVLADGSIVDERRIFFLVPADVDLPI